jgi:mono/diheme cytochrome c family protein
MTVSPNYLVLLASILALTTAGCMKAPGKPGTAVVDERPEQTIDFTTLYAQNCVACHGEHGKNGAALALANPVYLAAAGENNITQTIANGRHGTMMPPFAKSSGGALTDQQVAILAHGMETGWGNPSALNGEKPPAYASLAAGDPVQGQKSFAVFCASCHGANGEGVNNASIHVGSIVDPAYLALISDQGLRSIVIAGRPDEGMPDWRNDLAGSGNRAMTDQEVTDTVAWLGAQRGSTPNQLHP